MFYSNYFKFRLCLLLLAWPVALCSLMAQGNENDLFSITLNFEDGSSQSYDSGPCGFGKSAFGGAVLDDFCAQLVIAHDIDGDSICCDPVSEDLTGNIALVFRGACDFSLKAYHVEQAGAIGCMVVPHISADSCDVITMAAGDSANQVTIPCVYLSRKMSTNILNELENGNNLEACFMEENLVGSWEAQSDTTAENTSLEHKFRIFPNPGRTFINVTVLLESPEEVQLALINGFGQMVVQENYFTKQDEIIRLDVSGLPPGVYMVSLATHAGYTIRPVVIAR